MRRRSFMLLSASVGVSVALDARGQATDPIARMTIVNSLGSLDNGYGPRPTELISEAAIADARRSGVAAFNLTVDQGASFRVAADKVAAMDAFIAARPDTFVKVLTVDGIRQAKSEKKIGIIFGFQNSAMVEHDVSNVDKFADLGLRVMQLTYNDANQVGDGSLAPGNRGLSPFGREVLARLNARRIIVDLSHSGRQTCLDAARTATRPVCISHTGCAALAQVPRNKTDEELRLVADRGGYVGIYFMPFLAPGRSFGSEDVAAHLEHAIKTCGEDQVGIGTDHGIVSLRDMDGLRARYANLVGERRALGISAPGEDPALLPYPSDLTGPDQFRRLAKVLKGRGHRTARIEKIFGQNFIRYAGAIWEGRT